MTEITRLKTLKKRIVTLLDSQVKDLTAFATYGNSFRKFPPYPTKRVSESIAIGNSLCLESLFATKTWKLFSKHLERHEKDEGPNLNNSLDLSLWLVPWGISSNNANEGPLTIIRLLFTLAQSFELYKDSSNCLKSGAPKEWKYLIDPYVVWAEKLLRVAKENPNGAKISRPGIQQLTEMVATDVRKNRAGLRERGGYLWSLKTDVFFHPLLSNAPPPRAKWEEVTVSGLEEWLTEYFFSYDELALFLFLGAWESLDFDSWEASPALVYWLVRSLNIFWRLKKDENKDWKWADLKKCLPAHRREIFGDHLTYTYGHLVKWASRIFSRQLDFDRSHHDVLFDPARLAMASCLCKRLQTFGDEFLIKDSHEYYRFFPTDYEYFSAIEALFNHQLDSGLWPRSSPIGSTPYERSPYGVSPFAFLTSMLQEFDPIRLFDIEGIDIRFEKLVGWCETHKLTVSYGLTGKQYSQKFSGWNLGVYEETLYQHQPNSWDTAQVYTFLTYLKKALQSKLHDMVFKDLGQVVRPVKDWNKLTDAPLCLKEIYHAEGDEIPEGLIDPIYFEIKDDGDITHNTAEGSNCLSIQEILIREVHTTDNHPGKCRSALLFGPPGTGKTSLVRAFAKKINWNFVELDPSDFLSLGEDKIHERLNNIFDDLSELRKTVVFIDEMDAFMIERTQRSELSVQFLTTSMLPKLARLYEEKNVICFFATNHFTKIDQAAVRPGRFDLHLCINHPNLQSAIVDILRKFQSFQGITNLAQLKNEEKAANFFSSLLKSTTPHERWFVHCQKVASRFSLDDTRHTTEEEFPKLMKFINSYIDQIAEKYFRHAKAENGNFLQMLFFLSRDERRRFLEGLGTNPNVEILKDKIESAKKNYQQYELLGDLAFREYLQYWNRSKIARPPKEVNDEQ